MPPKSLIPQFDLIDQYKFYDLNNYGWLFENTNKGINNNLPIIEKLSQEFSDYSGIGFKAVKNAFNIDYIYSMYSRNEENMILIYTNKNSEDVHYYLTNTRTETFHELTK